MTGTWLRFLGISGLALLDLHSLMAFVPVAWPRIIQVGLQWAVVFTLLETAVRVGRRHRTLVRPRWVADQPRVRAELTRYASARRLAARGALASVPPDSGRGHMTLSVAPVSVERSTGARPRGSTSNDAPTA